MSKEVALVLSVIIGLFPACDGDDSKPPGGGSSPPVGEGEGEGSPGEGEGEGSIAGEGEGVPSPPEGEGQGEGEGACGNACGENEQCIDGQCSICPDASERFCPKRWEGFECVNVQNDPANCGECGIWCNDFGYECINGACVCRLDADHCAFEGADICTDLARDWNHCGECGNQCPRGSECFTSQCGDCVQSWDLEQCNGDCIVCDGMADVVEGFDRVCAMTATDEMNCGECGNRCATGERCEESRCVN